MNLMGPIEKIVPQDDYTLYIELTAGHKIILDFSKKLHTIRFYELANPDVFKRVKTDGYSAIWKNGKIVVSFGELIDMLQSTTMLYRAV